MKAKDVIIDIKKLVDKEMIFDALVILEAYFDETCKRQREICTQVKDNVEYAPKPDFV